MAITMSVVAILSVTHTEHYNLVDSLLHLNATVTPETWDLKNETFIQTVNGFTESEQKILPL